MCLVRLVQLTKPTESEGFVRWRYSLFYHRTVYNYMINDLILRVKFLAVFLHIPHAFIEVLHTCFMVQNVWKITFKIGRGFINLFLSAHPLEKHHKK